MTPLIPVDTEVNLIVFSFFLSLCFKYATFIVTRLLQSDWNKSWWTIDWFTTCLECLLPLTGSNPSRGWIIYNTNMNEDTFCFVLLKTARSSCFALHVDHSAATDKLILLTISTDYKSTREIFSTKNIAVAVCLYIDFKRFKDPCLTFESQKSSRKDTLILTILWSLTVCLFIADREQQSEQINCVCYLVCFILTLIYCKFMRLCRNRCFF